MTLPYVLCTYLVAFIISSIFFCKYLHPSKSEEYFVTTLFSAASAGMVTALIALVIKRPECTILALIIALMGIVVYIINYFVNVKG